MNRAATPRTFALTVIAVSLVAIAIAATGCANAPSASPDAALPTDTPGITGAITYLAAATDPVSLASITVEGGQQPEGAVSDKAVVNVTKQTGIFDANGEKTTADKLQVGTEVKVWFTGPVAESYPVQGAASAVQITGSAPK